MPMSLQYGTYRRTTTEKENNRKGHAPNPDS